MHTFLENKYGKKKKEENETKISVKQVEAELSKLIDSITNIVPPSTKDMSRKEKQDLEIQQAAMKQAQVFFRKALREFNRGVRYLR